jgi:hypothetical protein
LRLTTEATTLPLTQLALTFRVCSTTRQKQPPRPPGRWPGAHLPAVWVEYHEPCVAVCAQRWGWGQG